MKILLEGEVGLTPLMANVPDWRFLIWYRRGFSVGTDVAGTLVSAVNSTAARGKRDFMTSANYRSDKSQVMGIRKSFAMQSQLHDEANVNSKLTND
jgi:hypothetical protein